MTFVLAMVTALRCSGTTVMFFIDVSHRSACLVSLDKSFAHSKFVFGSCRGHMLGDSFITINVSWYQNTIPVLAYKIILPEFVHFHSAM